MKLSKHYIVGGLVAALIACGPEPGTAAVEQPESSSTGEAQPPDPDPNTTTGGSTSVANDVSTTDAEPALTSTGDTSSSTGTDGDSSTGDDADASCSKVDFLVVIDHSMSMAEEEGRILTSFPTLLEALATGPMGLDDVHILVTDTDAWVFEDCYEPCPFCDPSFTCATKPLPCEDVIGAGITYPRSYRASNVPCEFTSGGRYIDATEPDVAAAFQCAADVGLGSFGHYEHALEAAIRPLQPWSDAWACNEGWLRDDAILVLVVVTDEDESSAVAPLGVEQALVTAKHDDMSAVVVLGLMGDIDQPDAQCVEKESHILDRGVMGPIGEGAGESSDLRELVEAFGDQGLAGSVCAPSYEPFFEQAIPIIEGACEGFTLPR